MAIRTSPIATIESDTGIVVLEYDWDDTGLVTGIDGEGELVQFIEDQPLIEIRMSNTMTSGTVQAYVRPGKGPDNGKRLEKGVPPGLSNFPKSPGVTKVQDIHWFGLGVAF